MTATLIYCYDPMCSWCWGFRPTWQALQTALAKRIERDELVIQPMLGGLAPDSDVPMPMAMRQKLEATWQRIASELGTEFNYDFWRHTEPRRSTYPANRSCMVARDSNLEMEMYHAIQQAYYLEAKNPSNLDVLADCAEQIGLNREGFLHNMHYVQEQALLEREIENARHIGLNSFPSLALLIGEQLLPIPINYQDHRPMLALIEQRLKQVD
ncbi:DSBA-like thioredoxin domain protein [Marinomonas aquimarina]|uniref:DSBA-like thioredoxin domain protein n=1 Tax=Marinomonas aquimarina TaxID=295068 RepID=A0A1A8TEU2_9GAMM|nr:DsbA family protein [Marinomonas aquimarina]SBS30957.1 DSBA-like thioredoxin domain protein [Marinomonas aquimarina]